MGGTRTPCTVAQGVGIDKKRPTSHFNILVIEVRLSAVVGDEMVCVRKDAKDDAHHAKDIPASFSH
jgi:hypothetical protein